MLTRNRQGLQCFAKKFPSKEAITVKNEAEALKKERSMIVATDTLYIIKLTECMRIFHLNIQCICNSYTMVVGIYGSKPTEPEGAAPRARWVYVAINP